MDPSDHDNNELGNGPAGDDDGRTHANGPPVEDDRWLRSVVENSSQIVTIVDPDGTLRYANPAWQQVLGYDLEEAIGTMNVLDYVHPEDLAHVLEETEKALSEGGVVTNETEYRFRRKDGSWRWMESLGTYLLDDPAVGGVVVVSRDVTDRVAAEERLRFQAQLLGAVGESVIALDVDGRVLYWNEAAGEMYGWSAGEALGRQLREMVVPENLRAQAEEVETQVREDGSWTGEFLVRRKDGNFFPVEATNTPVLGEDGGLIGVIGVLRDVTERKEAEEALRRSEAEIFSVLESITDAFFALDHELRFIYVNSQAESLFSARREDLIGERLWEEPNFYPHYQRAVTEGETVTFEGYYPPLERWYSVRAYPSGSGLSIYLQDVTERKEAEERLKEGEERFRSAFDDAAIGMALVAPDGRFLKSNRSLCEILGYPENDLVGKTFQEVTHPDDLEEDLDGLRTLLAGHARTYQVEKRYLHREGHVVWALLSVSLVQGEGGEPLYFVSQIQDVTERNRAETALREAEARYRTLVEQIPAVTYVDPVDDPDNSLYTSPHIERMLGYTPEEWLNEKLWPKRLHPDDRDRILAADERFEKGEDERFDEEYRLLAKDGSVVWVREEAVLVKDGEGKPLYWQGIMHDITDRKEYEEALRRSEERYRNVVEEQTELVCRYLPDLTLTFVNEAFCRYFGKGAEELVGGGFLYHVHEEDYGYHEDELVRLSPEGPTATVEERVSTPGGMRWLQWTDTAIFDAEGRIVEYQSVGRDVTERRRAEQRLEHAALHDPLTGLPNRRLLVDRLEQALRRTRREGSLVVVLFMDLDGFKVVNDSLGHEAGDLLLTVVAQRLRRCSRPEDTLARFGGDEFVVLLEDVENPGEAARVAERITEELRRPFVLEGRELYATASIGVSWGEARTTNSEDLLRDADTAMYQAKREVSGYRVFDPAMHEQVVRRLEMEHDLRRAVETGEFVVHYQPIFDFGSQEPWGMEALVRWNHPEMGLLSPSEFVPLAEETGLIMPIGAWVLQEACRRTKEWQDSHPRNPPLGVIVNLSAKQLRHPGCEQTITGALARSGLAAGSLSLDVTESAFIDAVEANAQALERIQALGVRISIDDFGMGYSSLSYLKRLPADALKIDKSFVKGFGKDAEDTAIVTMVVGLAHTLGMEVVAEGVETWTQAALLAETGCDMAQGFHFAKPLSPEAALEFLNSTYQGSGNRGGTDSLSDS